MITQAVILVGGLGTRLGALTAATPKPLLPVAGVPFLDHLIFELGRFGIKRVLLCAQFEAEQIVTFAQTSEAAKRFGITMDLSAEPHRAGTGGALFHAAGKLDDVFFLLNGDSWFDINLFALAQKLQEPNTQAALALRPVDDASRFGVVTVENDRITRFLARPEQPGPALINGGVYVCRKSLLIEAKATCSFEQDILPNLAAKGQLAAFTTEGYFIDIGIPDTYALAQEEVPRQKRRKAVFLDRDGVLNEDFGHVGSVERFQWVKGAVEAVRWMNDNGFYVFLVTNQAGIGKGLYSLDDMHALHAHMRRELAEGGAHLDDIRFCPDHPEAVIERFKKDSLWRKPEPGMLLDLMEHWDIESEGSFLIGDKESDIAAAQAAGVQGYLFQEQDLMAFLANLESTT